MYAIVNIQGQQMKVEENQEIFVNRMSEAEGAKVEFNEVLLFDKDGKNLINQNYDANKWVLAKDALKDAIDNAYVDDLRAMADIEYNPQVIQYRN